jgi:hypothetical protein
MEEEIDNGIQVEVLANLLKMDKAESKELLETLATRLEAVIPDLITVERKNWLFDSKKPVSRLTIRFDDIQLQLTKEKTDSLTAKISKIVRGVILKTTTTTVDDWFKALANELSQAAKTNAQTRDALSKFVLG